MSDILDIFKCAVFSVSPENLVRRYVRRKGDTLIIGKKFFDLSKYENIYVIGAGKASLGMAEELEKILGDRITEGICSVPEKYRELKIIEVKEASHPLPDERSVENAESALFIARKADKKDLVLCLFSGGGSSLLALPPRGLTLKDKRKTVLLLLKSGADIGEINIIRKHISSIKGGRLAKEAQPATVISLLISDVVGDDVSSIASGPTVIDKTTYRDCIEIINRYNLELPKEALEPTPKFLLNAENFVIGNNLIALKSAKRKAEELGYNSVILSSKIEGEAREVARFLSGIAKGVLNSGNPVKIPACIISGGETTVKVKGKGEGGRNQELALAFAIYIDGIKGIEFLSASTDGIDGPTDACGAIVDDGTVEKARSKGLFPLEYLINNDSYNFHNTLGTILKIGPTHTNVGDVQIIICKL